ncbi:hypothetical protein H4Q26_009740 [Puccinia striiformis f. sp. tritici PST-130]|nr:hypothetical protein H4Q26_009740 [Puccinia striiformis f. sp. tritici PST-130]
MTPLSSVPEDLATSPRYLPEDSAWRDNSPQSAPLVSTELNPPPFVIVWRCTWSIHIVPNKKTR